MISIPTSDSLIALHRENSSNRRGSASFSQLHVMPAYVAVPHYFLFGQVPVRPHYL